MKEQWKIAEDISKILNCKKNFAYGIISKLKKANLLEKLLQEDQETIDLVKSNYDIKELTEEEKQFETMQSDLKIAQWYVNKIGSLEKAKALLNIYEVYNHE